MPERAEWLFRGQAGYLAMMGGIHPQGFRYVEPLEALWGLGCPIVGEEVGALSASVARVFASRTDWDVAVISGLFVESRLVVQLQRALGELFRVSRGPTVVRCVSDLRGGLSAFLGRRSNALCRSIKKSIRRSQELGVTFERCPTDGAYDWIDLFERMMAVEQRSWKGRQGVGVHIGPIREFYRLILLRLLRNRSQRILFARYREQDVAYIFGGVCGRRYRGLQFSYDDAYRSLSLGNLCQYYQISDLCKEGIWQYDLGTWMEYKQHWAELAVESTTLMVTR